MPFGGVNHNLLDKNAKKCWKRDDLGGAWPSLCETRAARVVDLNWKLQDAMGNEKVSSLKGEGWLNSAMEIILSGFLGALQLSKVHISQKNSTNIVY